MSLFDTTELCTDTDLSNQESRMPEGAKKLRGESGASPYDGKRALAKLDIGMYLRKRRLHPDGLTNPLQLNRAATFLELALIYSDMASRNDSVSWDKSKRYQKLFEFEMESIQLDYDPSLVPAEPDARTVLSGIPLYRA